MAILGHPVNNHNDVLSWFFQLVTTRGTNPALPRFRWTPVANGHLVAPVTKPQPGEI